MVIKRLVLRGWSLFALCSLAQPVKADAVPMVPFVIPATPAATSLAAFPAGPAIKVDSPHVQVVGSHFSVDGKPIRFWAVNLTFEANFPEHADAEALALRLSQAGINCVRLHHMDMSSWNGSDGIWDPANPTKLSAEAIDRLDYLLAQLARRGIYADVNLHVSRTHSKYLGLPPVPKVSFDKMTDLFMPTIIESEKDYARQLLGHVNKYRGVRLADDPLVAMVEISNEDSFFEWAGIGHLEALSEPYASTLQKRFCDWLQHRYGSTAALRTAWSVGSIPLGEELLRDNQFADLAKNWFLEVHEGNSATVTSDNQAAHLSITAADATAWHVQFQQQKLRVRAGQYYTVKVSARADREKHIGVTVSQAHEPWEPLGLDTPVAIGPEWKELSLGFVATADDDQSRLIFQLAETPGTVDLKDVSLHSGGREGLRADESLEAKNIAVFGGGQTDRRMLDTPIFLAETQKAFYDGMNQFIKTEMRCRAPVTGSIIFGPLDLYCQSDMDYVDAHAYWHHPEFPGRDWDMQNWIMKQEAMVDHPEKATLFELASSRLAGKPFTCTEYSHPAPNDFQVEGVPEIATFAAAQDWDAVFLFDYGAVPTRDHFENFFDTGPNPAKFAFLSSAATIFRDAAISPLPDSRTVSLAGDGNPLDSLATYYKKFNLKMTAAVEEASKIDWHTFLTSRLDLTIKPADPNEVSATFPQGKGITWKVDSDHQGIFTATGPGAFVWIGHQGGITDSAVTLAAPSFAAITLVATDRLPLSQTKRVLITACGKSENTGMNFVPDRHTLTGKFGHGPVLIEPVEATVRLPGMLLQGQWQIQALGPAGRPIGATHDVSIGRDGSIQISAADQTVWHLLTRK
jgi:hypothetical protein